ncbi:MAG: hypothetical protein AB1805_07550 [Nitrospirota bacterium]
MSLGKEMILEKARLAEKEKRLKDLRRRAENYIIILRDIIDPGVEESEDLDLCRAELTLKDFIALNNEIIELKAEIRKKRRELEIDG